jgi:ABC-type branched-subunit amino acid transport system substrate-binding protein
MTVFESPFISLEDQAIELESAAKAFNARGGANGSCIQIVTCDDGANIDQAVGCVKKLDEAGVVATVNDLGSVGQAEVMAAMTTAGIPRIGSNPTNADWSDLNSYPMSAGGTGTAFLMPQPLADSGIKKVGLIRVDLAPAAALVGLLEDLYKDDGVTFPFDAPVPAGTTDYSQFIIGAENAGAGGVTLALGAQEGDQVIKAAQQLNTDLQLSLSLGTASQSSTAAFGDFAKQMMFIWPFPGATADLPVYKALRADLASSGKDSLQPGTVVSSAMSSWIGLYATLRMIRDAKMTTFTREGMTSMLRAAKDVPMLGMFGDENWTPDTNHEGIFKRAGMNHWGAYRFDANAKNPVDGLKGNFVEASTLDWDKVVCGSIFGAPQPCAQ